MTQRRALLLSCFMLPGYGVSEVAVQLRRGLANHGWDLRVGYFDGQPSADGGVLYMPADAREIAAYCSRNKIEVVVAQTSPYFEVLPALRTELPVVCYEHGDPTPAFFSEESAAREAVRQHKIREVYPNVTDVWTTSHFLRHDIDWPNAKVVPLAADHVGERRSPVAVRQAGPVRVGSLARMGKLESEYKGTDILCELARRFRGAADVQFTALGRGTDDDAKDLIDAGMQVVLNASDDERRDFLESLDVFISPSKWEGFNLPLVEAEYLSIPSLAFDVGAHPETTPFVVGTIHEAEVLLRHWISDRAALLAAGEMCKRFTNRFSWDATAGQFAALLDEVSASALRGPLIYRRVRGVVRREGFKGLLRKIARRFVRR